MFRSLLMMGFVILAGAMSAEAMPVHFGCISTNTPENCATAEEQILVYYEAIDLSRVRFTMENSGPDASSVTDIYIDDGDGLFSSLISITNGGIGVAFSAGASPANLLNASEAVPPFSADFSLDSNSPVQANGIGPGEFVSVLMLLELGVVFDAIQSSLVAGALRIGMRVQDFPNNGSESVVSLPLQPMPTKISEPPMLLIIVGVGFILFWGRLLRAPLFY